MRVRFVNLFGVRLTQPFFVFAPYRTHFYSENAYFRVFASFVFSLFMGYFFLDL
jgi:hypothetical protein